MNLVIVESPTKARTIGKFLGKDYVIKASMGHVVDLPKSTLAVDTDHDFAPDYQVVADKKKIIAELKAAAKGASQIILATDPDREGEAIAYHVAELLQKTEDRKQKTDSGKPEVTEKLSGKSVSSAIRPLSSVLCPLKRIVFHEITKEAIEEAFKHSRSIDENLVNAQTARRVLDRLVGYKLSPLLWQKVRRGLSAGRVQSVALRLIVEREREIEKFGKETYYTIHALLNKGVILGSSATPESDSGEVEDAPRGTRMTGGTEFELIEINNKKIEQQKTFSLYDGEYKVTKTTIDNEQKAKEIVVDLKTKQFVVVDVMQKETHRSPQPPYTTSTLQQDAAHRLGLNGKRSMSLAQKLYEEGYITYHRTDSVTIAISAQTMIRTFVQKEHGEKYLPEKPRFYATKQKLAQEAHEAIRPTKVSVNSQTVSQDLGAQYAKLYDLIWKRAIASQMSDAIIESTTVLIDTSSPVILGIPSETRETPESVRHAQDKSDSGQARMAKNEYRFKATGSVLVFEGFLKVNPQALQDNRLPQFMASEKLRATSITDQFHETTPPPRYNDASLIKTLEEKGIGRPSTYATIVSTIESRQYIERTEGRFSPTPIGVAVNDFLVANFSDIDDIPFTAEMEDALDDIAHGKKEWVGMMKDFYGPFEKQLANVKGAARVKIEVEQTDEACPVCKNSLVVRTGKFGKFLSCSTFPECKFSKPFVEKAGIVCPKDGGDVVVKKTRKGRKFFGCSNYPKCDFAAWTRPTSPASEPPGGRE